MIPTILEAGALNEVDIVEDWCLDTAAQRILMRKDFRILFLKYFLKFQIISKSPKNSHNVAKKEKLTYYERTLDLNKIDLAEAALEDGIPMLKITFETDKTMAFTDKNGNIVSGEGTPQPDDIYRCYHQALLAFTLFTKFF